MSHPEDALWARVSPGVVRRFAENVVKSNALTNLFNRALEPKWALSPGTPAMLERPDEDDEDY